MRARTFQYTFTLPCSCIGGKSACGVLGVVKIYKGEVEIGFSNKKSKYKGNTNNPHIYLEEKQIKSLIKYLQSTLKED